MKKVVFVALLAVLMVAGYGVSTVLAQAAAPVPVTVTGDNVGLLKTLAAAEAANASATCGALNALKVGEAKGADGKAIADLVGKLLYYLPTKAAEPAMLGDKLQGKKVVVTGKLFKAENALLVEKVEEAAAAPAAPAAPPAPAAQPAAPAAPGAKPAAPGAKGKDDFDEIPVKSKSGLQVL